MMAAQLKSFSRASQQLYISQPAVSRHIKALEEYYKTRLFERKGSSIGLTAAGSILLEKLIEVKNIQETTEQQIAAIGKTALVKSHHS